MKRRKMNETNISTIYEALPGAPYTSVPRSSVVIHYNSCIHCFMIMDINIYIAMLKALICKFFSKAESSKVKFGNFDQKYFEMN